MTQPEEPQVGEPVELPVPEREVVGEPAPTVEVQEQPVPVASDLGEDPAG